MHVMLPGYSDPRPHINDRDWPRYLQHCELLGTGRGLPRSISRNRSGMMPQVPVVGGDSSFAALAYNRGTVLRRTTGSLVTIDIMDEQIGDPTEIGYHAWMRERIKGYVQGWAAPKAYPKSPFGEHRFRVFTQEPYFPFEGGFIARPLESATRLNSYEIGKPMRAHNA